MFKKISLVALVAVVGFIAQTAAAADNPPTAVLYQVSLAPIAGQSAGNAKDDVLKVDARLATTVGSAARLRSVSETPYVSKCSVTEPLLTGTVVLAPEDADAVVAESSENTEETFVTASQAAGDSVQPEFTGFSGFPACETATLRTGYQMALTPVSVDKSGAVRTAVVLSAQLAQTMPKANVNGMSIDMPQYSTITLKPADISVPKRGKATYDFAVGGTRYRLVLAQAT